MTDTPWCPTCDGGPGDHEPECPNTFARQEARARTTDTPLARDDDDETDPEAPCLHCGGDGWVQCRDPIQCTRPHNEQDECECASCGGTGLRKDMTIW